MKISLKLIAVAALTMAHAFTPVSAGEYPNRPIKVIVPNGAGGGTDIVTRTIAEEFSKKLGADLAIVNMPGGGSSIGAMAAADSKADGYTLLSTHEALLTSSATGANTLGPKSLIPVAQIGSESVVLAVPKDSTINSLQQFYDAATKGASKKLNLGVNPGAANHFALLGTLTPVDHAVKFIPTGGGAKTLKNLMGGHIDGGVFGISEAIEAIRGEKIKPLAVFASKRHPDLPNVPTAKELGYDIDVAFNFVWYAPAGTPRDRITKLADAMSATVAEKSFQKTLASRSITPSLVTGSELNTLINQRYKSIQELAKKYLGGR